MIATENESGATIRLNLAVRLEWFPAQRMNLSIRTNLEIQLHSRLVIIVRGVLIFPVNLIIVPTPFIFVGFYRAELLGRSNA